MVYIAKNQNFGLITGLMLFLQNPYIGKKKKKKKSIYLITANTWDFL